MGDRERRRTSARRTRALRTAVTAVAVGALVLAGCDAAQDETTSSDSAVEITDRLLEAFNAEDAEEVAAVFGDDVAFTLESGEDVVGAEAAAFWQSWFGRERGERVSDGFQPSDGRTFLMTEFTRLSSQWTFPLVFEVEMDGERLVRMGSRMPHTEEVIARGLVDDLYAALNDQDADWLAELFEGLTYMSPSGEESSGQEGAERWAHGFGFSVTRVSEVFELGDGVYWLVSERTDRDSGRSTSYAVEVGVDVSGGGQITSLTEQRQEG